MEPTKSQDRRISAQKAEFPGTTPKRTVYSVEQTGAGYVLKEYEVPLGWLDKCEKLDRRTIPDLLGIVMAKLEDRIHRADGLWKK
jgi:hypothetical protein